jgi:hypothetical protein
MKASENKISSIDRFINIALQSQIDQENISSSVSGSGVKNRNHVIITCSTNANNLGGGL